MNRPRRRSGPGIPLDSSYRATGAWATFVVLAALSITIHGLAASRNSAVGVAATYYVDSETGNDQNDGTSPSSAWKSLDRVNRNTFSPAQRILFKSGDAWRGQLWPKGSGTEGRPIVVSSYGGGVKPLIECAGLAEDAILLKNQEYWEIDGLEVTNTGARAAVRRGVHLALRDFGDAHHIYVRNLTIHDVNGSDELKQNGGIDYTADGEKKPSRFIDLRIENNEIYHVDRSGIFGWSDAWVRRKWFPSQGIVVRANSLYDIGGDGIVVVAADGALIESNVVGRANQRSADYNVAIWAWSADNTVIQFNEAYGTKSERDGEGFDSDWNSRNTLVQYNYSHDNDGGFLLVCNDGGVDPADNAGNTGTIARYNISQNDRTRGITLTGPVSNTKIYNNTIYVGPDRRMDILLFGNWKGWSSKASFYNNIFYAAGEAQFSYGVSRAANGAYTTRSGQGPSTGNTFHSNSYFDIDATPKDPSAIYEDPKFVAGGSARWGLLTLHGYDLKPGSPAQSSGMTIAENGGRDFWGTVVPSCGVSRGAIQSNNCRTVSGPAK